MKRLRVVNRARFMMSVVLMLLVLSSGVYFGFGIMNGKGVSEEAYIEIQVMPGDSLWSIAAGLDTNNDIREVIYEIAEVNEVVNSVIHPGQILKVPATMHVSR